MAMAISQLPVKKYEVKTLTTMQIIRQTIAFTTDRFLDSFIFLFESKLFNKLSKTKTIKQKKSHKLLLLI